MLPEHVERAIDLSREKYCSVWNTFRQDIELVVAFTIEGPASASEPAPTGAMSAPGRGTVGRLSYIDWMRGLAILVMIEAHVLDAWTRPADRQTLAFGVSAILAGFAAPMFLFLAGVSVALAASSGERKTGSAARAAARVRRRGWEVFGLAYLFRLQAYILNPKAMLAGVLKVDILNIMGPSIVAAAALWQVARHDRRRLLVLGGAALAVALRHAARPDRVVDRRLAAGGAVVPAPDAGPEQLHLLPVGRVRARRRAGRRRHRPDARRRTPAAAARVDGARRRCCSRPRATPGRTCRRSTPTRSSGPAPRCSSCCASAVVTATLSVLYFYERRPRLLGAAWRWASPMVRLRPGVAVRLLGARRAGVRRVQRAAPPEPAVPGGRRRVRDRSASPCSASPMAEERGGRPLEAVARRGVGRGAVDGREGLTSPGQVSLPPGGEIVYSSVTSPCGPVALSGVSHPRLGEAGARLGTRPVPGSGFVHQRHARHRATRHGPGTAAGLDNIEPASDSSNPASEFFGGSHATAPASAR